MTSRILLMCALGEDINDDTIDFWEDGKLIKKSVSLALKDTFGKLVNRIADPHIILFPFLADTYIFPHERCFMKNAKNLRNLVQKIVDKRRKALRDDPKLAEDGDFLTILLTDDLFKDNNKRVVDEALTFFFAGIQASAVSTSNLILNLLKHPEYQTKIL